MNQIVTPTNLAAALKAARPGATLRLAPGSYGDVTVSKVAGVRLVSESAANPARFRTLSASECRKLTLEGLSILLRPDAKTRAHTSAVRVFRSSGVVLQGLKVRCGAAVVGVALDSDPNQSRAAVGDNVVGLPTGRGVTVDQSSDVLIQGCELAELHKGVVLNRSHGVVIRRCDIGEVRTSPIVGTGLGAVTIAANRLHTARPWNFGGRGDHGDFIHFWTGRADKKPAGAVVIVDNLIDQANGAPILGVFLEDQNGLGYPDVEIARNTILNGNGQGLALSNTKARVLANTLLQTSGTVKQAPSILLRGASVIEARGNTTHDVYGTLKKLASPSVAAENRILPGGRRPASEIEDQRAAWAALHRAKAAPKSKAARPRRRAVFDAWETAMIEPQHSTFLRTTKI